MTANEQEEIFKDWLGQYKGLLFKVVRAYADTPMDMDDLFQEVALQVWKSIPSFKGASAASTWIYRIAINTAINWMRRERRHRGTVGLEEMQGMTEDPRLTWLYEQIHQMDGIDRSITLLLLEGYSYKEMAAIMGISETNIGVKILRIKKKLIARSEKQNHYGT